MNYISSNHAGKSGTNRTTQAEISNLLRHSFPGRVTAGLNLSVAGMTKGGLKKLYRNRPGNLRWDEAAILR